jgi:hypothetical protein
LLFAIMLRLDRGEPALALRQLEELSPNFGDGLKDQAAAWA